MEASLAFLCKWYDLVHSEFEYLSEIKQDQAVRRKRILLVIEIQQPPKTCIKFGIAEDMLRIHV